MVGQIEDGDAVMDPRALERMREFDPDAELTRKWIRLFMEEAPGKVSAIEVAVEAQDTERVAQLAHSLKTQSGWLGGQILSRLLNDLETNARLGSAEDCEQYLPGLRRQLPLLRKQLQSYLELIRTCTTGGTEIDHEHWPTAPRSPTR